MKLTNEFAPQMRRKSSTFTQMLEFFACVCVLWVASMIFYFVKRGALDGTMVIVNGLVSILFSVIADVLFNIPALLDKSMSGSEKMKEYGYRIIHSYSYVTGLLLALLCPIGVKWWELAVTSFGATFITKLLFGGFGQNIMNPAVFGRVFMQLAFTSDMKTYIGTKPENWDITTGASMTGFNNGYSKIMFDKGVSFGDLLIGNYFGTLGETFAVLLVLICVYLCVRKIIDWRTPVFYIGSLYLASVIMFLCSGDSFYSFKDALSYIMVGGIMFGGVLCLTDPVTSPTSKSGRIMFALAAALVTFSVRTFARQPEAVAYSILLVNLLTPLIDKLVKGRTRQVLVPYIVMGGLSVLFIGLSVGFGLTHKIDINTGDFVSALASVKGVF